MGKKDELDKLVDKRRRKDVLPGYKRLGDYSNADFECNFVSPYSKGAHNLNADVMILLQDWSSDQALRRSVGASELGRDPNLPTNRNLCSLMKSSLAMELSETYATNLFPFIKAGGLSSRIPFADFVVAAKEFAIPQIRIIAPRLVVCLGKTTFNTLRVVAAQLGLAPGLSRCRDMSTAIDSPFDIEFSGRTVSIWAQAHPGAWGQRNRNMDDPGQTLMDWKKMSLVTGLSPQR